MEITVDITSSFNKLFVGAYGVYGDYQSHTVLFWDFPEHLQAHQEIYMINSMLNIDEEMIETFKKKSPYFDDIVNSTYVKNAVAIAINKRFKLCFQGIKGADIKFYNPGKDEKFYLTYPYTLKKGDYYFDFSSYLEFTPHVMWAFFVADQNANVTITFDSDSYVLIDPLGGEHEAIANSQQTPHNYKDYPNLNNIPYKYHNKPGKLFNVDWRWEYFHGHNRDVLAPEVALKDEE